VVEVEPYGFSKIEMPGHDDPASDWADYFQRCMTDAGFRDVTPIALRSNFVAARSLIGNPLLEGMIRERLAWAKFSVEAALENAEAFDEISSFYGGLALLAAGSLVLQPSCCGALRDVQGWKRALESAPKPANVWIGHPDVDLEFTAERVVLREGRDDEPRPDNFWEASMPLEWLSAALHEAQVEHVRFRDELVPMVSRILGRVEFAREVASRLAGLD
jgi:hypothetical protein